MIAEIVDKSNDFFGRSPASSTKPPHAPPSAHSKIAPCHQPLQERLVERADAALQTIDPFFSAVNELAAQLHEAGNNQHSLRN
jgi:hypothetical protein